MTWKECDRARVLTLYRSQIEGQVRTRREQDTVRGTYNLETAEEGKNQDTERKQASQGVLTS